MHEGKMQRSQLILTKDGRYLHTDLKKEDGLPKNILIMGPAGRVDLTSSRFDEITFRHRNKERPEFYTVAGTYKQTPVAAMSIGISMGPMEIAVTELHALFEYDPASDSWTNDRPKVNIIRVGTCGTSLPDIPVGVLAISDYAIGLDNLGAYYPPTYRSRVLFKAREIEEKFRKTLLGIINPLSYCSVASFCVVDQLSLSARRLGETDASLISGITTASPGFFGPEGREIGRIRPSFGPEKFMRVVQSFNVDGSRIINHEMETSVLFRIGYEHLGYNVGAICLVLDNLATDEIIGDEKIEKERMNVCIQTALGSLVALSKK